MNKYKKLYPITMSMVSENPDLVEKIFVKLAPHKGVFIGVCALEGCFMCDSPGEMFSSLELGEKLRIDYKENRKSRNYLQLEVQREDGAYVGVLPFEWCTLPNMLFSRGLNVWCHLEVKDFKGGIFTAAVSIYCEDY